MIGMMEDIMIQSVHQMTCLLYWLQVGIWGRLGRSEDIKTMIYKKFLCLIPIYGVFLILLTPYSAYASGPRFDYLDDATDQERTCYRDGYEQGFVGMYDSDRASECYTEGSDEYNKMWNYACLYTGRSESECNDIASNPEDVQETVEELGEKNKQSCFDSGYNDGLDHPYDHQRSKACNDYGSQYYHGFLAGCTAVANNTEEICKRFTDA